MEANLGGFSPILHHRLLKLLADYNANLNHQELLWRQKSRQTWLQEGNANTQYFYLSTIMRRRKNRITNLIDLHGNYVTKQEGINRLLLDHFMRHWQQDDNISQLDYPLLTPVISSA